MAKNKNKNIGKNNKLNEKVEVKEELNTQKEVEKDTLQQPKPTSETQSNQKDKVEVQKSQTHEQKTKNEADKVATVEKSRSPGVKELQLIVDQFTSALKDTHFNVRAGRLYSLIDGVKTVYGGGIASKEDLLFVFNKVIGEDKPLNSIVVGMYTFDWVYSDEAANAVSAFVSVIEHAQKNEIKNLSKESVLEQFTGEYLDLGHTIIKDFFS